jgi:ribosomal protection tetracycline resistance protein
MGATVGSPGLTAALCVLEGVLPAARVHELQQQLPALTRGEGVLESSFSHYQPVRGRPAPRRPRPAPDPAVRKEYLLQVERRVSVG